MGLKFCLSSMDLKFLHNLVALPSSSYYKEYCYYKSGWVDIVCPVFVYIAYFKSIVHLGLFSNNNDTVLLYILTLNATYL